MSERREDFSIDAFRHLETKLSELRRRIMDRAASIAREGQPTGTVYCVKTEHVNQAWKREVAELQSGDGEAR